MYDISKVREYKEKLIENEKIIYNHYLQDLQYKKNLYFVPWRKDNTPSLALYRSKYTDKIMWKDLAYGDYGDVISFLLTLNGTLYNEELKNLIEENNTNNELEVSDSSTIIQYTTRDFTELDRQYWSSYCIDENTLNKYNVKSLKQVFINKELSKTLRKDSLGFVYSLKDKFKLYFPKNKKNKKFMANTQNVSIGLSKLKEQYTQIEAPIFVITKSLKDVMCLDIMGIPATEIGSESIIPSKELINSIREFSKNGNKPSTIFIITDGDEAGIAAANKIQHKFKNDPDIKAFSFYSDGKNKDISDFVQSRGLVSTKLMLIDLFNYYQVALDNFIIKVSNETFTKLNKFPLLASYGTLRFNQGNSIYREQNQSIVRFFPEVSFSGYKMFSFGGFPGVHKTYNPEYNLVTDLWVIANDSSLKSLDSLEGHPFFYHRETIFIWIQNIETGQIIKKETIIYVIPNDKDSKNPHYYTTGDWVKLKETRQKNSK